MIQSTKGKHAANAVKGKYGKGFPGDLVKRPRAMLTALDAAVVVEDLRFPPGNHLEELKGDRAGQHSVQINGQWRICFVWTPNGPADVEIVDYHLEDILMSLLEDPMHPGEVLKELYLDPLDMGAIAFARRLDVPRTRIERLIKGTTGITPDTALRLARVFNTTPAYWVNLQTNYDRAVAAKEIDVSKTLSR